MITTVGMPVQIFIPLKGGGNQITPGIINKVDPFGAKDTQIRVFPIDGSRSYVEKNVRHHDFRIESHPFWQHISEITVLDHLTFKN